MLAFALQFPNEDDVVSVPRLFVPVDLSGAQRGQAVDVLHLTLGVQFEVDARRDLQARIASIA